MKNATCFWINLLILFTLYILTCKLLKLPVFCYMYEKFVPNVDYLAGSFKIINKPYFEHCKKSLASEYAYENICTYYKENFEWKVSKCWFWFLFVELYKNCSYGAVF